MKRVGFGQALYRTSSSKKDIVGTYRMTQDNRGFRYCLAGATALDVAKLTSSPAEADANLMDEAVAAGQAAAIGDSVIQFTAAGATTLTQDELQGGLYVVNDATGEGQVRRIAGNAAVTAGTAITITLDEPLAVATVVTTTQHTIFLNPWSKVVICATVDFFLTGVPMVAVPLSNYSWHQTKGWGVCWNSGTTAAGSRMMPHTTDGQMILDDAFTEMEVGYQGPAVGVDTEYMAVFFTID
jgi:hypothetical protein